MKWGGTWGWIGESGMGRGGGGWGGGCGDGGVGGSAYQTSVCSTDELQAGNTQKQLKCSCFEEKSI